MTIPYIENRRKVIIVVGGANGLGRAISELYASDGWNVAILDQDEEAGRSFVSQFTNEQASVHFHRFDVRDSAAWERVYEILRHQFDCLDLLVNCAASLVVGDTGAVALADQKATLDVTLGGTVFSCETFVPWLAENPEGARLVNVASCAGFLGMPWSSAYNAAKAGVVAYSETLHNELKHQGIDVTVACPGFFASGLFSNAKYANDELQRTVNHVVSKSTLDAKEVAVAIRDAAQRGQLYLFTPWSVRRLWWFKRWLPLRLLEKISEKSHRIRRRFAAAR